LTASAFGIMSDCKDGVIPIDKMRGINAKTRIFMKNRDFI